MYYSSIYRSCGFNLHDFFYLSHVTETHFACMLLTSQLERKHKIIDQHLVVLTIVMVIIILTILEDESKFCFFGFY